MSVDMMGNSSSASSRLWKWLRSYDRLRKIGDSDRASRTFSEVLDESKANCKMLDPRSSIAQKWNKLFLVSTICAVFIDPLFFFLLILVPPNHCIAIDIDRDLAVVVTVLRTITDTVYLMHMFLQFRTAFVAPPSRVFGRGELVVDPRQIARRYLRRDFWLDSIAVLPLPQLVIWKSVFGTAPGNSVAKDALPIVVFVQYTPRLFRIFPLTSELQRTTGVLMKTAWAGAAYNLVLYILASHVISALWYFLAVRRQYGCWREQFGQASLSLIMSDCSSVPCSGSQGCELRRAMVEPGSNASRICRGTDSEVFDFGIYQQALKNFTGKPFLDKYFYCLWWGFRTLNSSGQDLETSTSVEEEVFAIAIGIAGLTLFALLIGNIQTYLQSLSVRTEEMRIKSRDTEEWMGHRQLPLELRERVRKYHQFRWLATRGVEEDMLLQSLPPDLRRDIKRHLCYDLVRRVPLFAEMDEKLLDGMCQRLKPALYTESTYVLREGDPVDSMVFIIRGHLESITTNGGRTGFLNVGTLNSGDFCGEELLTWALDPDPSKRLPSSTRTVEALVDIEAFSLRAQDLKFVAGQFRRLHSKQLQLTFRHYSQQWRTWAACFIQAAWRRYKRGRLASLQREQGAFEGHASVSRNRHQASGSASQLPAQGKSSVQRVRIMREAGLSPILAKPHEPDFSVSDDE